MYLNVIPPPPAPVPNVNGLGQFRMVHPRRGIGQAASSCAAYLAQQLAALPPASTAAMLLNTPTPSGAVLGSLYINGATSPEAAAQIVYQLASEFCGQQQDTIVFGGTPPADCSDGGTAAANAAYPAWLAYYSSLPASVWTIGTVSPQVANPQAFPSAPAPAGNTGPASNVGIMVSSSGGVPVPAPTPAPAPAPAPTYPAATPGTSNIAPIVAPAASTSALHSWLTGDIAGIPVWGWGLGVLALLFVIPRGR